MVLLVVSVQVALVGVFLSTFNAREIRFLLAVLGLWVPFQCKAWGEYFATLFANVLIHGSTDCWIDEQKKIIIEIPKRTRFKQNLYYSPSGSFGTFLTQDEQKCATTPSNRKRRGRVTSFLQIEQFLSSVPDPIAFDAFILNAFFRLNVVE